MFRSSYGYPLFTYISAFAGIFCVVILAKQWTISIIRYIGANSMLYYAWHQSIMTPIVTIGLRVLGFSVTEGSDFWIIVGYKIFCTVFIVVMLTICNCIISYIQRKVKRHHEIHHWLFHKRIY